MSVKLVITFHPKPEFAADFESLMRATRDGLPNVSGCRGVSVLKSTDGPIAYTLIESWDNPDIHQAHVNGLVASGEWAKIAAMLSEEPQGVYYEDL